jgi:hypothetical protein
MFISWQCTLGQVVYASQFPDAIKAAEKVGESGVLLHCYYYYILMEIYKLK